MPQGTTVENICSELRYLPVTRTLAEERALLILCDQSYSTSDAVEVALVIITHTHTCTCVHLSHNVRLTCAFIFEKAKSIGEKF